MGGQASRENGKKGGRPKGSKDPHTLLKEDAREMVRQLITAQLSPIVSAHVTNALGIKYLVTRNAKTGKFERVSKERMEQLLESGSEELELVEVYDKDPSVEAFKTLLDRALDKPKEQALDVNLSVKGLEERIRAARERHDGK